MNCVSHPTSHLGLRCRAPGSSVTGSLGCSAFTSAFAGVSWTAEFAGALVDAFAGSSGFSDQLPSSGLLVGSSVGSSHLDGSSSLFGSGSSTWLLAWLKLLAKQFR